LPETSYAESSFTGAQTLCEQAWVAAKDLFPDMSSSELEVSYSSKGKLQVKMFGAGKKTYDVFTKNQRTGKDQINPSLSKEIKKSSRGFQIRAGSTNGIRKTKRAQREAIQGFAERKKIKRKWMK